MRSTILVSSLKSSRLERMSQDLQLNNLCHICEGFNTYASQVLSDFQPFDFHNINELIQSAKEGCHVCNLIVAELLESEIRDLQRELEDNPQHGSQQLSIGPLGEGAFALKHLTSGDFDGREVYLVKIDISYRLGEYFLSVAKEL